VVSVWFLWVWVELVRVVFRQIFGVVIVDA